MVGDLIIKAINISTAEIEKDAGKVYLNLKYLCEDQFGTQYIYDVPRINLSGWFEVNDENVRVDISDPISKRIFHSEEQKREVQITFNVDEYENKKYYSLDLKK